MRSHYRMMISAEGNQVVRNIYFPLIKPPNFRSIQEHSGVYDG